MRKISSGFTLIELLIVVAVVGILTTIGVVTFARIQADARDSQRSSRVTVISEALEKYYLNNGEYPSCADMTKDSTIVSKETLKGIDPEVLSTPHSGSTSNSIVCTNIDDESNLDVFAYVGDGSESCNSGEACLEWSLKYREEATGQIKSLESRHKASIASTCSAAPTIASRSFSKIDINWTPVDNAFSYTVQIDENSAFSSPTESTTSGTSNSFTGLQAGTQYFFRVQPQASTSTGCWSPTANATTLELSALNLTATANSNSQITASWNSDPNATSYILEYDTQDFVGTDTTPTKVIISGITTTSRVITGLETGVQYFFRVRPVAGAIQGDWSNTDYATTNVPAPTCTASTLNSNRQITVSWSPVSVADSYTLQYANNSSFNSPGTLSGLTTTSRAVTGLNNGTTYYFRVMALNGSTASVPASCPTRATGVDGPSSVGWSSMGYAVRNRDSVTWMPGGTPSATSTWSNGMHIYGTCSPGATVVVKLESYYAYSNNTTQNTRHYMDWTWGNQVRYVIGGSDSWKNWWHGWVACQVGSSRAGDRYLGNAGGY